VIGDGRVDASPADASRIAELCGYLPLALRVVAERTASRPLLSLADVAAELIDERSRLDVLADQEDELSDIRAVFSWSYRALAPQLRRTFRLLGLHEGADFGSAAAAALVDTDPVTVRRWLRELAGAHLVQEISTDRYRLHDLLRSYAAERARVEESQDRRTKVIRRVLSWYLLAADAGRRTILPHSHAVQLMPRGELPVPDGFAAVDEAMRWFDVERMNLLAALRQALRLGQYDIAWKLPVVVDGFFELRAHWTEWEEIHQLGLEAAVALGDPLGRASNLLCLGDARWRSVAYDEAAAYYRSATELGRQIPDPWLEGFALRGLGLVHEERDDVSAAAGFYAEALPIFQANGIRRGAGMTLLSLGTCSRLQGRLAEAVAQGEQAVATFRDIDDDWSEAWGRCPLALSLIELGRGREAIDHLRRSVATFRRFADQRGEALARGYLGDALHRVGDVHDARRCWEHALRLYDDLSDPRSADIAERLRPRGPTGQEPHTPGA